MELTTEQSTELQNIVCARLTEIDAEAVLIDLLGYLTVQDQVLLLGSEDRVYQIEYVKLRTQVAIALAQLKREQERD